jgi:hypothetical protein
VPFIFLSIAKVNQLRDFIKPWNEGKKEKK